MAGWRALGFVPDSDEEDDTQTSDHSDQFCLQHSFHDIDEVDKDAGEVGRVSDQHVSPNGLEDGQKGVEGKKKCTRNQEKNKEAFNYLKRHGEQHHSPVPPRAEHSEPSEVKSNTDDVDELQQDHYEAKLPTQPVVQVVVAVEIKEGAHSISPSPPYARWDSALSSPLTELPPSPLGRIPNLDLEETRSSPPVVSSHSPHELNGWVANSETLADDRTSNSYQPSRNLRHRNPIQLHPYAIESEKYRQVLKARGVKPLRIAQMQESSESQNRTEFEGAEFEADQDSQPLDSEILVNLSPTSLHERGNSSLPSGIAFGLVEEEFPEVGDLLRHYPSHVPVGAAKRRKVQHPFSKKEFRPSQQKKALKRPENEDRQPLDSEISIDLSPSSFHEQVYSSPPSGIDFGPFGEEFPEVSALLRHHPSHVAVGAANSRKILHTFSKRGRRPSQQKRRPEDPETPPLSTHTLFDLVQSRPRPTVSARQDHSPPTDRGFRVPLGASPTLLPTPAASSEPRTRPMAQPIRSTSPIIEISTESSSEEGENLANPDNASPRNEEDHRLERVQRKMRGVLPASWLKLDLRTQNKKPELDSRAQLHGSPDKTEPQRGVARRIFVSEDRSIDSSTEIDFPIVISDDENSDMESSNSVSIEKGSDRRPLHARPGNGQSRLHPASMLMDVQGKKSKPIGARLPKARSLFAAKPRTQSSLDHIMRRHFKERPHAGDKIKSLRKPKPGNHRPQDKGHLVTSLRNSNDSRPALLESLQEDDDQIHPEAAFRRHILNINRTVDTPGASSIILNRFLDGNIQSSIAGSRPNPELRRRGEKGLVPSRSRKRSRRRTSVDSSRYRQRSPSVHTTDHQTQLTLQEMGRLHGLGSFGTRYTQNFDIAPLPAGVFIHSSTIIGSGRFYASLQLHRQARLDTYRGFATLHIGQEIFKWGPWNDQVSTQLGAVFGMVSELLQLVTCGNNGVDYLQTSSLLMNVINYFSDNLSFLDPIDRVSCLQRCRALLEELLSEIDTQNMLPDENHQDLRLCILTLLLIFASQLRQLSTHELVPQTLNAITTKIVLQTAQQTLFPALNERFESLTGCLENLAHLEACEYGIREKFRSVEALVVAHHVLRESNESLAAFWEIVRTIVIAQDSNTVNEVSKLESSWKKLFTILPFLGLDAQGILDPDQRFKISNDGWTIAKQLICDVLLLSPSLQGANFNSYCRGLFGRCLHLVIAWGWSRCESIIGTMFDFFARNDLAHLSNENSHGSPRFLENLDGKPDLTARSEDRCFHIFLKVIGSGLHDLQKLYPEKKLRDIVWRLMPNHGRLHPKEETLCRRDLDACRNHHDLLCTLYWASPPAVRPRLSVIRNLVHLESSHREACHINIRAWSNLVRFQLSTDEDISALKPFSDWHDDFLGQLLLQHYSARIEAEDHVHAARSNGDAISNEVLETTVARNQRQVAVMLDDALISLKSAMDVVRSPEQGTMLLTPALVPVFDLFNSRNTLSNRNIVLALDVVLAYANQSLSRLNKPTSQDPNDDSQDYGDWSAFDDDTVRKDDQLQPHTQDLAAAHLLNSFHEPIKQLLSNSFGADTVPEDALLLKIIDVWVAVARILVCKGARSWNDYVSPFGTDSWESLRRTEQKQKFTNYYLSVLIENDADIYLEYKSFFLSSWIDAMVERESIMKFQHRLTSGLLNACDGDPLMRNLPFWVDPETSKFNISASDFLVRRLSLISSFLSNMRESLEDAHQNMASNLPIKRQEYQVLVRHLMNAMKRNYQELGHASNASGSYVEFVQRIIGFLQQHTLDICPIDRFFTDSTAFPLPAADPSYVIGRLKNYGLRLQDSRTPKQLAVFLQSVSERAAVDGQQVYLVGQLHTAMSNVVELGDLAKPTLQSFLIEAIVPAYIDVAFSTSSGWLLASPLLQALRNIFRGLLTSLDGTKAASIAGVVSIISAFVGSAQRSMELLIDHSGLLEQPQTLRLLGLVYAGITALLPTLDYIVRLLETPPRVVESIYFFKSFAIFSSKMLLNHDDIQSPNMEEAIDHIAHDTGYREIQEFALKELRHSLGRNWVCHDGRCYVVQGNTRREIVLTSEHVLPFSEEKTRLLQEFIALRACWDGMPALRGDDGSDEIRLPYASNRRKYPAGDDLII
ncbi:hypothetical protein MMC07_003344 [Pseudocyphellaria aurata]|nr:hypothetical protein [Pseudocyphellaria aurata]